MKITCFVTSAHRFPWTIETEICLYFFKYSLCIKPYVPRKPRRDLNNRDDDDDDLLECSQNIFHQIIYLFAGTVRIWHANTYRLESTLNYGLERAWTISCLKGSNNIALGYDEGSIMIKVGKQSKMLSNIPHEGTCSIFQQGAIRRNVYKIAVCQVFKLSPPCWNSGLGPRWNIVCLHLKT